MRQYNPDSWIIVELGLPDQRYHRVLGCWAGGFAGSDSWRLSSGITRVEKSDNVWLVHNESGSVYRCHENAERMSLLASSVFNSLCQEQSLGAAMIPINDILETYQ